MRVIVQSIVPEIEGEETIITALDSAPVESLIHGFCVERRLPSELTKTLVIRLTPNQTALSRSKPLDEAGVVDGSTVLLDRADPFRFMHCSRWCFLALLALVISIIGIVLVCVIYFQANRYPLDYTIVIDDAGSTTTQLYVFKWEGNKYAGTGIVELKAAKACDDQQHGLAWYANDTSLGAVMISKCLEYAATNVPQEDWSSTAVFLGGSSSMRLLRRTNASAADTLIAAVRNRIQNDFTFQLDNLTANVRIFPGYEEAAYNWLALNYGSSHFIRTYPHESLIPKVHPDAAASTVQWPPPATSGLLRLENSSMQIAYAVVHKDVDKHDPHEAHFTTNRVFGQEYTMYSHGFSCYGSLEFERRFLTFLISQLPTGGPSGNTTGASYAVNNPCAPLGSVRVLIADDLYGKSQFCTQNMTVAARASIYEFHGTSQLTACQSNVTKVFSMPAPCDNDDANAVACLLANIWKPPNLVADSNFTALAEFYHVASFFMLNTTTTSSSSEAVVFSPPKRIKESRTKTSLSSSSTSHPSFIVNRTKFIEHVQAFCLLNSSQALLYNPHYAETSNFVMSSCLYGYYIQHLLSDAYGFRTDAAWNRILFMYDDELLDETDELLDWPLGFALVESNAVAPEQSNYVMPTSVFVVLLVSFASSLLVAMGFAVKARREHLLFAYYYQRMQHSGGEDDDF